jgi:hypothetical protein
MVGYRPHVDEASLDAISVVRGAGTARVMGHGRIRRFSIGGGMREVPLPPAGTGQPQMTPAPYGPPALPPSTKPTRAPCSAKARTVASLIPEAPPVTITDFPCKLGYRANVMRCLL